MITLAMVSETIDRLRQRAADQHHNMRRDLELLAVSGWAEMRQHESAGLYALAMSWHDVIRGCRTDEELQEKLITELVAGRALEILTRSGTATASGMVCRGGVWRLVP